MRKKKAIIASLALFVLVCCVATKTSKKGKNSDLEGGRGPASEREQNNLQTLPPSLATTCPTNTSGEAEYCQIFTKEAGSSHPIDFLWVIDNSGSMADDQEKLAENFETFINQFANKNQSIDFKMGIITTDNTSNHLTSSFGSSLLRSNKLNFIETFKTKIKVGDKGSNIECGLGMSLKFSKENPSWVRNKAYLFVIYISDENDHSSNPNESPLCRSNSANSEADQHSNAKAEKYFQVFDALKPSMLFKAFAVVNLHPVNWRGRKGKRYIKLAELSGGKSYDIKSDFSTILQDFGSQVAKIASQFQLKYPAQEGTVEVFIDGVPAPQGGWSYLSNQRAIRFIDGFFAKKQGKSTIKVTYRTK